METKIDSVVYIIAVFNEDDEFKGYISENYYGNYILNESKNNNVKFMTEEAATNFIYHNYVYIKDLISDEDTIRIIPINEGEN